jgi:hypothetical protein
MSFLSCFSSKPSSRDSSKQQRVIEAEPVYKSAEKVPVIPVGFPDSDHTDDISDPKEDLSGFDTAREEPLAKHTGTAMAQISTQTTPKTSRYPAAKQHDPSIRFVKELPKHPEYRCLRLTFWWSKRPEIGQPNLGLIHLHLQILYSCSAQSIKQSACTFRENACFQSYD